MLILYNIINKMQKHAPKGQDTLDVIRQRGAIFRFSLTDNFDPDLNISNI